MKTNKTLFYPINALRTFFSPTETYQHLWCTNDTLNGKFSPASVLQPRKTQTHEPGGSDIGAIPTLQNPAGLLSVNGPWVAEEAIGLSCNPVILSIECIRSIRRHHHQCKLTGQDFPPVTLTLQVEWCPGIRLCEKAPQRTLMESSKDHIHIMENYS